MSKKLLPFIAGLTSIFLNKKNVAECLEKIYDDKLSDLKLHNSKIYDVLVPVPGVSFQESGREPKTSPTSIGQYTGQLSKDEFRTMIASKTPIEKLLPSPDTNKDINTDRRIINNIIRYCNAKL